MKRDVGLWMLIVLLLPACARTVPANGGDALRTLD